jgi:hypothetical protein
MAAAKKPVKPAKPLPWYSKLPNNATGNEVKSAIASELVPLDVEQANARASLAGDQKAFTRAGSDYENALQRINQQHQAGGGEMLRSVANLKLAHDREQAGALQFLRGVIGNWQGGSQKNLGSGTTGMTMRNLADMRSLGGQMMLNQQANSGLLGGMRASGAMQVKDASTAAQNRYSNMLRELEQRRSQTRMKAPMLLRQYALEDLAAQSALAEAQGKYDFQNAKLRNDLTIAQMNDATKRDVAAANAVGKQAAADAKKFGRYKAFGIEKQFDQQITNVLNQYARKAWKKPWRGGFDKFEAIGLAPDQAAMLATRYIKGGKNRTGSLIGWLGMLENRGVSVPVQKQILKQVWGKGAYSRAVRLRRNQPNLQSAAGALESSLYGPRAGVGASAGSTRPSMLSQIIAGGAAPYQ